MSQNAGNQMGQVEFQQAIQDCSTCHDVCMQTAANDRHASGDHAKPEHIALLQDCAALCQTAAHFMQHNSPLYGYVTQACAQVATHCADESDQMGDTDAANACRNAAWACDQVTKMVQF
jgi:hypothetical protein